MKVRFDHSYFDFNQASLVNKPFAELDRIVHFMIENLTIEIELGGHTYDRDSGIYNKELSQYRSDGVMFFLIYREAQGFRMIPIGYRESQLKL